MPETIELTPQAELKLEGRTVTRSRVANDWGNRIQWKISRDGKVLDTPNAQVTSAYTHPDETPGAYEIVLETWKHEGFQNGALGKYIEISNKVTYTI